MTVACVVFRLEIAVLVAHILGCVEVPKPKLCRKRVRPAVYCANAFVERGGINAVDIGQTEAGRALGLPSFTTMKSIVLPQAVKNVLPAIGNEFISLLKETSIIGFLGVIDLTKAAERVISRTMDVYFPYISIALVYLAVVCGLNYLLKLLERRLAKSDR